MVLASNHPLTPVLFGIVSEIYTNATPVLSWMLQSTARFSPMVTLKNEKAYSCCFVGFSNLGMEQRMFM